MSGDNLHGMQPIKFYSEKVTESKILLLKDKFKKNYQEDKMSDLEKKHKDWERLM